MKLTGNKHCPYW